jgi:hypothetical protein
MKRFVALLLLFFPGLAIGQSITGVTGALEHGQSITITGSGFGVKSPAAPYFWADFSGGTTAPSVLGIKDAWTVSDMSYDADEGPGGGPCLKGTANYGIWTARIDSTSDGFAWNDYGQKIFISRKINRNFSYGSINFKVFRAWATGHTEPNFYVQYGSNWNSFVEGISVPDSRNGSWFSSGPATGTVGEWQRDEIVWQSNSASDQADGIFQLYTNNTLITYMPNAGSGYVFKPKSSSSAMTLLYPVHGVKANHTFSAGENYWATDVYVDTTWARVMVCDSTDGTWANRSNCEMQIPSAWSATSITATVNRGAFGATDSAYLYVVDADGSANSTGYAITFGDEVDPPAPTCEDGIQNGDEEGIDCGGSCPNPCSVPGLTPKIFGGRVYRSVVAP